MTSKGHKPESKTPDCLTPMQVVSLKEHKMPEKTSIQNSLNELNELIVNCPEFEKLEGLLGGFNIFQVLKFEHGEIRHSNVLAWIMDPGGSHGLGSTFLKKWLMRILHESSSEREMPVAPVDIDSWQFADVEVRREWLHIDLLIIIKLVDGGECIVVIENKIRSIERTNQLKRYREVVEKQFPHAKKIFIFLTKDLQKPTDTVWEPASYDEIHTTLKECLQSRSNTIGAEPKVLLENYIKLIEEKFMDESEIAKTARSIYKQHKRALDVIFENRPDNIGVISEGVRSLLEKNSELLQISVDKSSSKSILRFIPNTWDVGGNSHGQAWGRSNRTIVFEVLFEKTSVHLKIVSGSAPLLWLNQLCDELNITNAGKKWRILKTWRKKPLEEADPLECDDLVTKVYQWIETTYKDPDTKNFILEIENRFSSLEAHLGI